MDIYFDEPYIILSRMCKPSDIINLDEIPREVPTLKKFCMLFFQKRIRTKAKLNKLGLPKTLEQQLLNRLPFQYDVSKF